MAVVQGSELTAFVSGQLHDTDACPSVDDLYRLYMSDIRNFISATFGAGPPYPDDIVQAAFVKVAAMDSLNTIHNPRAFLYRVAHNIAVSSYRRSKTRLNYVEQVAANGIQPFQDDLHPERVILASERMSLLDEAYHQLPKLQQELLVQHRIHKLSYADIARNKGMSQTEVKRQIAKAVVACLEFIEQADDNRAPRKIYQP